MHGTCSASHQDHCWPWHRSERYGPLRRSSSKGLSLNIRAWRWGPLLAVVVAALASGCIEIPNKLFSCEQDADCERLGGTQEPYICRANVCVQPGSNDGPDGGLDAGSDGGLDAGSDGGVVACTQVSAPLPCLAMGWCWDNPLAAGSELYAIRGRSETDIWAVGKNGAALHWDGQCWARRATGKSETELRGIWPASEDKWWAVGEGGTLLEWNGSAWLIRDQGAATFRGISGSASGMSAFAVGDGGSLLALNGQQWTPRNAGTSRNLSSVWVASDSEAWAFADDGFIFHGVNGVWNQDPFTPSKSVSLVSAVGLGDGGILAVGTGTLVRLDGAVWKQSDFSNPTLPLNGVWHDSNRTWLVGAPPSIHLLEGSSEPSGTPRVLNAVWSRGEKAWAVGESGTIVQRLDSRWSEAPGGVARTVRGLWQTAGTGLWAVGDDGLIMRRVDGLWRPVTPPASTSFRAIQGFGEQLLVLGADGKVYTYQDGQWSPPEEASPGGNLNALWGTGPDQLWAVGESGLIRRRTANGSWVSEVGAGSVSLNAIWGSSATDIWAVGNNGSIYHRGASCNATSCWTPAVLTTPTTFAFASVWGSSTTDVWAVGNGGVIYRFTGSSWAPQTSGTGVALRAVAGRDSTHVWAVGDNGLVLIWEGSVWTRQTVGLGRSLQALWVTQDAVWAGGLHGTILKQQ